MFGGPESSKQVFAMKRILLLAAAVVISSACVASHASKAHGPTSHNGRDDSRANA